MAINIRENFHNYLIIALMFAITINSFSTYTFTFLILVYWLSSGNIKEKIKIIFTDKLSITFLIIFAIHLLGLLWSEDIHNGLKILSKQRRYILAPIIISFFDRRLAKYALLALLIAIFISEIYSIYLYHRYGVQILGSLPSPFMHHMHYSLILAFTFGYLVYKIDFKNLNQKINIFYLLFALLTLFVLFINKGRIGQISIVPILFILAVKKFNLSALKSILAVTVTTVLLFFTSYHFSDQFKERIDRAIYEYNKVIGTGKRDSIACRFEFWNYAKELGNNSPLIGIGTGDSIVEMQNLLGKEELKKMYEECGLGMKYQFNPHNNFMLFYMQFGMIGVILLLAVLFAQLKIAQKLNSTPMLILLAVTIMGMFTSSPISMHTKYIYFYTLTLTMLYLDALQRSPKDQQSS